MTLPIEQQAWDAFTRTPRRYHDPVSNTTQEDTMGLAQDIDNGFKELVAKGHQWAADLEQFATSHIPDAVSTIDAAETNPVVQAVLNAVHVPPSVLNGIARTLLDLEEQFAAVTPAPADPPAEVPAEVPAEPAEQPAA